MPTNLKGVATIQTQTRLERDRLVEEKVQKLRELLCTDLEAMPVNDSTVEWPEKLSPFVTVGRVHVPRQDISAQLVTDLDEK